MVTNTNMLSNINVVTELPGDDTGGNVNHGPVGKPEISGNLQQDETLTVDVSNISDENGIDVGTYDFQWFANGSTINGAIYTSLVLSEEHVGKKITVEVSYTDNEGNLETLLSDETEPVTMDVTDGDGGDLNNTTGAITIDGVAAEGETLNVNTSFLTGEDELGDFSYQWLADGLIIEGANSDHFTLSQEEIGKLISVEVNFKDNSRDSISFSFDDTVVPSGDDSWELDFQWLVQPLIRIVYRTRITFLN